MNILITGINGFVGSHLARFLLAKCYKVIGLARKPPGHLVADIKSQIIWVKDDLSDVDHLTDILEKYCPRTLIHAAAFGIQVGQSQWSKSFRNNVVSSLNIVEAAGRAKIPYVIHLGTSQEYGSHEGLLSEDTPLDPQTPYAATKAAAFYLCRQRSKEIGVHWVALRPFLSFGPGEQEDKLIPSLIIPLLKGNVPTMTGGEQIRDIVYVKDLIQGITKAIVTDLPSGIVINLGSGRGYTLREIAEQILKLFPGGKIDIGGRPYREPEVWHQVADVTFQREILPWEPSTQLSDALRETVDWYRQNSLSS